MAMRRVPYLGEESKIQSDLEMDFKHRLVWKPFALFVFAFLTICKWRGHLEAHKDKFNPMLVGGGDGTPQLCLISKRLLARGVEL